MSDKYCPIVEGALDHFRERLKKQPKILVQDVADQLHEIEEQHKSISAEPAWVRLRAFVAVEEMLGFLELAHERYASGGSDELSDTGTGPFVLPTRSWGGLTVMQDAITHLLSTIELDEVEFKLSGVKVAPQDAKPREQLIFTVGGERTPEKNRMGVKALMTLKIKSLAPPILKSVRALRPYLRNPTLNVRQVGENMDRVIMKYMGPSSTEQGLNSLRKLVEVKL